MRAEAHGNFPDKASAPLRLPDFTAASVQNIDFALLKGLGITHIVFDLDLTIRKRNARELEQHMVDFLASIRAEHGFELVLATNNHHNVSVFAEPIGARIFQPFVARGKLIRKPQPAFFERIIEMSGDKPSTLVMVGDKIRADVVGGNKAGMRTILLEPNDSDMWHDRLILTRLRERAQLKRARAIIPRPHR